MSSIHAADPSNMDAVVGSGKHDSWREGAVLGLVVATGIWLWVALVDAVAGEPFSTASMLGGIVVFTTVHYLLNVVYGVVIVSAIRGAARAPSLVIAVAFGVLTIEIGFAMVTILLSNIGLGALAWVSIFGGSVLGGAIAIIMLSRRYPLMERVREAEAER